MVCLEPRAVFTSAGINPEFTEIVEVAGLGKFKLSWNPFNDHTALCESSFVPVTPLILFFHGLQLGFLE